MDNITTRLGIFVFFDPQGIVDQYVLHLIDTFKPNFSRFIVVSNAKLDELNSKLLQQHCDALFTRENKGLDAGAFKDAMLHFCGWEELQRYDEIVLINDTFFGPVHSFDEMFEEMSHRDLDFWGISAGYPTADNWNKVKYGYIPSHIQTFFVAFRKKMVCSDAFQDYWNHYNDSLNNFTSVVSQHETVMTKHFENLGFKWDIFADTKKYYFQEDKGKNVNLYHHHPHLMMKDMRFPILKKKVLAVDIPDYLCTNDLEEPQEAMKYIQYSTNYDEKLIWDNVLRLYNITDLYHTLHLNYVLPSFPIDCSSLSSAALVCHVVNPFFIDQICSRVRSLSQALDIFVIPGSTAIIELLHLKLAGNERIQILEEANTSDMYSFLLHCKKIAGRYTYLGFIHDEKHPEHCPTTVPESTVFGYWQNAANDINYIKQLLHCFENNPRLGVLGTPFPIHHHGFANYGNEWSNCFEETTTIANELNLNCKFSKEKMPFAITGVFWCRTSAIQELWKQDWTQQKFERDSKRNESFRRVLPYIAQSSGYFSGIAMHTNFASMRITSQQYMLDQMVSVTRKHWGRADESFAGYMSQITFSMNFFKKIFRQFLERTTPAWFSESIRNFYRWFMRIITIHK